MQRITRRRALLDGVKAFGAAAIASSVAQSATAPGRSPEAEITRPGTSWPERRKMFERAWLDLLGEFPKDIPPLRAEMRKVAVEAGITRYHVSFQAELDDRVTGWLLVPERARERQTPAIVCLHSTTFAILSSEWEFYSHKILPKCLAAAKVYHEWRDTPGLPSVVSARKARRGYGLTLDYYQHHNRVGPERIPGMLETPGAGDCFSWFSFPGGHSLPGPARSVSYGWFDRWLGHQPA